MVDAVTEVVPGRRVAAEIHLDPTADPFLAQHLIRQRPVFPLVGCLETMAQTAAVLAPGKRVVGLRDVEAVKVLTFFSGEPIAARIEAQLQDDGVACRIASDFRNRRGQLVVKDQVHARATIELAEGPIALQLPPPGEPPALRDAMFPDREMFIYHGPVFRCLKKVYVDEVGGWGMIEAPRPADLGGGRRPDRWLLCPAVIDACFYACGIHYWLHVERAVPLPAGIERLRIGRLPRPGEKCALRLTCRGPERTDRSFLFVGFDFSLFGDDGAAILHADHYRSMILSDRPS